MILRLPSEQALNELQQRIKARLLVKVHIVEPRSDLGNLPKKRLRVAHKGPRATFEHQLLSRQLTQSQIAFEEEFRFNPNRRWRADFFIPQGKFIVEIVGGVWMKRGGHTGGQAQIDDMGKFNNAALMGYRVLQFTPQQVKNEEAIAFVKRVFACNTGEIQV